MSDLLTMKNDLWQFANPEKAKILQRFFKAIPGVNNWDLVDASAHKILGHYLIDQKKELLDDLAQSADLWQQRIAVMATFHFIKNGQYEETLKLAERFLKHEHDLIHKAVGWMLREVGKRDFDTAYAFLQKHYRTMPRTMLRYAIEKYDPRLRKLFLNGEI